LCVSTVSGEKIPDQKELQKLKTRAEILKTLSDSYDHGAKVLADMSDEKATEVVESRFGAKPRWAIVMSMVANNMDHYGNLVVYLRLDGIAPPRSAGQ